MIKKGVPGALSCLYSLIRSVRSINHSSRALGNLKNFYSVMNGTENNRTEVSKLKIPQQKIDEILKSTNLTQKITKVLSEYKDTSNLDKGLSTLLYSLGCSLNSSIEPYLGKFIEIIKSGDIKGNDQLTSAIKYCTRSKQKVDFDSEEFKNECGIGISFTEDDIKLQVEQFLEKNIGLFDPQSSSSLGKILAELRSGPLRWASGSLIRREVEERLKNAAKNASPIRKCENSSKPSPIVAKNSVEECARSFKFVFEGELSRLHKPGGNPQICEQLMREHLARTGGKVVTRFPPEPNGFLHIGHAKAMNINFGYAQAHGGITYLRYDDTNPEAEDQEYFDSILENVKWLGFEPHAITYSSDYFQVLYELALKLIKKDKAYVCHCSAERVKEYRGGDSGGPRKECKHRNRPISESIEEFEKMKAGLYEPGEAFLRMKMNMFDPNPQFWDLVAYRIIKGKSHVRTGSKWVIYPTYDYAHCLCDSLEDITHSLCTVEFETARPSYYWLVDAVEVYKPVQWEYGRLSITHTVLSKRRLNELVKRKIVDGWDDPRLWTLASLKRRGFTPESINAAMREIGVSRAIINIDPARIEYFVRSHLNDIAPRFMIVLDPVNVIIENLPEDYSEEITINQPKSIQGKYERHLSLTKHILIERSDFKIEGDSDFFRLKPKGSVKLMGVSHPIVCNSFEMDDNGKVTLIRATYADKNENLEPAKATIHWVSNNTPKKKLRVRQIGVLFLHPNPNDKIDVPDGWLSDINPNSMSIIECACAEEAVYNLNVGDKIQAVRLGYYCVDKDSTSDTLVLNLTTSLKQDSGM